ncbi:restriction endonuclease subunit S [Klebsiella variicola]|uniref:restriction endonuclease subunit S n=1 Tax=Klebsiella variicola TaxID=244366 RepID=UPI0005B618E4|nr:restriction endonuclease subunit S [Klebsiella variicola]MCE0250029.1 restriction endonuclease subunit S [Klebsiella variicola subsp. variicola]QOV58180.1 restriction endonuclease subunit S [Klebsiella variicola]CEP32439.1 Restriction modification system DNA specificity domain-containing protein [Klebsiella variicola]
MAKYKAYPEYKDSGVEWLGLVPESWTVCRLKNLATIKNGQDYKSVQTDDGYPVMGSGGQFTFASKFMYDKPSVLLGRKGTIDKPLYINEPFWTVDTMYYTELNEGFDAKYLHYLALTIQFSRYSTNTALPSMTQEHLSNYKFSVPKAESERKKITEFLDLETAKIDNLIEKQQQLIELLKEKRQAVISHAVTKGLNPDVPMKDSGVEWLGEVPEHWKIKRCKNLFNFVTSGSRGWAGFYSDEGDLFFRIANLTRDSINPKLDSIQYVTPPKGSEGERSKIKENDLLISITADLGSVCAADGSISGGYVSQHVSLCRPGRLVASSRWLAYFVLSDTAKEQLQGAGYGGTKVQLSLEDIRDLFIAYPPKSEQIKIASYLDERLSDLDGLDHRAHNLIELLRERRTALISAAVTGKIDVRDWVAPDTQDVEEPQEASV